VSAACEASERSMVSRLLYNAAHQTIKAVVELLIATYETRTATLMHSHAKVQ